MRALFKEVLNAGDLSLGPSVALLVFTIFMVGVFAWAWRPHARVFYEKARRMALDEGEYK